MRTCYNDISIDSLNNRDIPLNDLIVYCLTFRENDTNLTALRQPSCSQSPAQLPMREAVEVRSSLCSSLKLWFDKVYLCEHEGSLAGVHLWRTLAVTPTTENVDPSCTTVP